MGFAELCVFFVLGLVVVLVIVAIVRATKSGPDPLTRVREGTDLKDIAVEVGGIVERSPDLEFPYVRFPRDRLLWFYLHWYHHETGIVGAALEVRKGAEGTLEAVSLGSRRYPPGPPRMRRIREEDPQFRFYTKDPSWADALLSRGLHGRLVALADWMKVPIRLQITLGQVMVEVDRVLYPQGAMALVEFSEGVLALVGDSKTDVVIVEARENQAQGSCQVCGSLLEGAVVHCLRCQTPHHGDCWTYLGRCATFGCAGREAR